MAPVSDAEIAADCCAIYNYPDGPRRHWDHLDDGTRDDGVCWGVVHGLGYDLIVLRGSITPLDWLRNLTFIGNPFRHRDLREVHHGFLFGMPEMWAEARQIVGRNVIVTGHSLGAARADVLTALMALEQRPPMLTVVFGEPYPGFQSFCDLITAYPRRSYCNGDEKGHDLVTNVPFQIPPDFDYRRPSPLLSLRASPDPRERSFFRYHHMPLYLQAIRQAAPPGAA